MQIAVVQGSKFISQTIRSLNYMYFTKQFFELYDRWVQLKLCKSTKVFEGKVEIWLDTF